MHIRLDDPADPRLNDFRHLNGAGRDKTDDRGLPLIIGEGLLVAQRIIHSNLTVRALMGTRAKLRTLASLVPLDTATCFEVSREVGSAVVGFDMRRGLFISADHDDPAAHTLDTLLASINTAQLPTLALTENVADSENLGALYRNAAALGVNGIIHAGHHMPQPYQRRIMRVSMGTVLSIPWAWAPGDTITTLARLVRHGFVPVALTPDPQAPALSEVLPQDRPVVFLLGAEGPGLSEDTLRQVEVHARIPMAAGVDSLNISTAAAVAFYERRRGFLGVE